MRNTISSFANTLSPSIWCAIVMIVIGVASACNWIQASPFVEPNASKDHAPIEGLEITNVGLRDDRP